MWYVYIVLCSKDNTLYTGITNNLEKRIKAHNDGKGAKYTKTRRPVSLIQYFEVENKSIASKLEYKIKQLPKKDKVKFIMKEKALQKLEMMRKHSRMYAQTKEAFLMRVFTIIEFCDITEPPGAYFKHLKMQGPVALDIKDSFTEEWAQAVIDDAIKLLNEK